MYIHTHSHNILKWYNMNMVYPSRIVCTIRSHITDDELDIFRYSGVFSAEGKRLREQMSTMSVAEVALEFLHCFFVKGLSSILSTIARSFARSLSSVYLLQGDKLRADNSLCLSDEFIESVDVLHEFVSRQNDFEAVILRCKNYPVLLFMEGLCAIKVFSSHNMFSHLSAPACSQMEIHAHSQVFSFLLPLDDKSNNPLQQPLWLCFLSLGGLWWLARQPLEIWHIFIFLLVVVRGSGADTHCTTLSVPAKRWQLLSHSPNWMWWHCYRGVMIPVAGRGTSGWLLCHKWPLIELIFSQ